VKVAVEKKHTASPMPKVRERKPRRDLASIYNSKEQQLVQFVQSLSQETPTHFQQPRHLAEQLLTYFDAGSAANRNEAMQWVQTTFKYKHEELYTSTSQRNMEKESGAQYLVYQQQPAGKDSICHPHNAKSKIIRNNAQCW
jgi:hypothetical protein